MKVLGIVGSMRKEGNTGQLVEAVLGAVKETKPKIRTQIVNLSALEIGPCQGCYDVCAKSPYKCVVKDDFQGLLQKMEDADGIVLGAPLYFPVPSRVVALCERLVCLAYFHDMRGHKGTHLFEDKPCAFISATGGGRSDGGVSLPVRVCDVDADDPADDQALSLLRGRRTR